MPGQSVRISKKHSGLKRTFCVLRDLEGKYQCILETKSKNAANEKHVIETAEGGFKIGKPAWRLDGKNGPKPFFSLLLSLKENGKLADLNDKEVIKKLAALKAEIALPWEFDKQAGLQRNTLGAVYVNNKGLVVSVYSKKGMPLNKVLKKDKLTLEEREEIALSLLKTIARLHRRKIVFQDLKPANILLFRKKNGTLKVRLTDPGQVSKPGFAETSVATAGYESPEIALAHSAPDTDYYDYFKKEYKKKGASLGKKVSDKFEKQLKDSGDSKTLEQQKIKGLQATPANDMWAMGVTLFKLFRNSKPRTIPTDKRFAGFFAPSATRLTADQALQTWESNKPHR